MEEYDGGWGLATTVGIVLTYSRKGYGVVDRRLKSRASSPSSPCARLERSISPRKRTESHFRLGGVIGDKIYARKPALTRHSRARPSSGESPLAAIRTLP